MATEAGVYFLSRVTPIVPCFCMHTLMPALVCRRAAATCRYYDSDKKFPVWGFGGSPRPGAPVEHCFTLSDGSSSDGMCSGIAGVMRAYNSALQYVKLAGPTLFSQIIQQACAITDSMGCSQEAPKYSVLLIITDGALPRRLCQRVYYRLLPASVHAKRCNVFRSRVLSPASHTWYPSSLLGA